MWIVNAKHNRLNVRPIAMHSVYGTICIVSMIFAIRSLSLTKITTVFIPVCLSVQLKMVTVRSIQGGEVILMKC